MIEFSKFGYANFEIRREDWNAFELKDGSIILLKIVLVKVGQSEETEEDFDMKVNYRDILGLLPNPELCGEPSIKKYTRKELEESIAEKDIDFKQVEDSWNEYKLKDGRLFYLKPILTMVSRTNKYNEIGEPIYLIQSQVLSKTK